ncbi:fibronectin type III domain-containing protein (plasmid) [Mycobacterium sp. SMC-2]|uniref:fibronectin type III domain-containing protein n=1 Tax=Mycobacterium sp. SMC-2 TaxID=2857058 RepID=UPI0021B4993B|nr:fibronectin type III domain-containing protein [Mycobacterium sp. SMC-2]UXA06586.1 fibronectin type III domain-containing protein [Mycobacterium sp. SMC-2]UXA09676.1 fibronectin type III domain-containing protein [Mycobacterium sp. SMC-2]
MTGLPASGATQAVVLEPTLNPLGTRYWQIVYALVRDYYKADGTVFNLADPSVGLAMASNGQMLFTPFAADGVSIREDLLITAPGTNQGFYSVGFLKPESVSVTPDQTMTETPTAQWVRSTRNVLDKLDDKIAFEPLESSPLTQYLKYEKPLAGGVPALGTPNLIIPRGNTDVPVERVLLLIGIDGDGQLKSRVFPRIVTDKKAKAELGRKAPDSQMLNYSALPCAYSKNVEWTCYAGSQWNASGDFDFLTTAPVVTPVTGLDATIVFPTPIDITSPVYTVALQETANGSFTSATLSGSPTVSGGFTTVTISGLTASTTYNAAQVTATGSNDTATSPVSAPFTSTAS